MSRRGFASIDNGSDQARITRLLTREHQKAHRFRERLTIPFVKIELQITKMDREKHATEVMTAYRKILEGSGYELPFFTEEVLNGLTLEALSVFRNEPGLCEVSGDFFVVGDLHGHVFDLIRIIRQFGLPPAARYIFLGDMVDRGPFSTETIALILALKVLHPEDVFVIRGNHEFHSICSACGFLDELTKLGYSRTLYNSFISVFNIIPLGALVNENVLCIHGGIGPNFRELADIERIPRSIGELYGGVADSIMWSDPSEDVLRFETSVRGRGYHFGAKALEGFLQNNGLRLLVRGHQSIEEGIRYGLNEQVVTVFSASNYCNVMKNNCGVLQLFEGAKEKLVTLEKLPYVERGAVKMITPDGNVVTAQTLLREIENDPKRRTMPAAAMQRRASMRTGKVLVNSKLSTSFPRGLSLRNIG